MGAKQWSFISTTSQNTQSKEGKHKSTCTLSPWQHKFKPWLLDALLIPFPNNVSLSSCWFTQLLLQGLRAHSVFVRLGKVGLKSLWTGYSQPLQSSSQTRCEVQQQLLSAPPRAPLYRPGSRRTSLQVTLGDCSSHLLIKLLRLTWTAFLKPTSFLFLQPEIAAASVSPSPDMTGNEVIEALSTAASCLCTTRSRSTLFLWGPRDILAVKVPGEEGDPAVLAQGQEERPPAWLNHLIEPVVS